MKFLKIFSAIIFASPWIYLIKIPLKDKGSINLLDVAIILFLLAFLVLLAKNKSLKVFLKWVIGRKIYLGALLFLFFIGFSLYFNLDKNFYDNIGLIKSFFVLPILFGVAVSFLGRKNPAHFYLCLKFYLFYSSALSVAALASFVFQQTSYDNRVSLFFNSPNHLAFSLSLGLLISLFFILRSPKKLPKIFVFTSIFHLIGLILTQSAGAVFSVFLLAPLFLYSKKSNKLPQKTLFILLFLQIISLIIILNFSQLLSLLSYNPFQNRNSIDSRAVIYLVSGELIKENYFFGSGPTDFQEDYLQKQSFYKPYPQWAVPHSHNLFAQIWFSFGLLGLFSFLILFFQKGFSLKNNSFIKPKTIITIALLCYFLLHGLVDNPLWHNDTALFFWFLLLF